VEESQEATRICLKCRKEFKSTHCGNRICQRCGNQNDKDRLPRGIGRLYLYGREVFEG